MRGIPVAAAAASALRKKDGRRTEGKEQCAADGGWRKVRIATNQDGVGCHARTRGRFEGWGYNLKLTEGIHTVPLLVSPSGTVAWHPQRGRLKAISATPRLDTFYQLQYHGKQQK